MFPHRVKSQPFIFEIGGEGGVHGYPVDPCARFRLAFKTRQAVPDLEKYFLVKVIRMGNIIEVGTTDPVDAGMIGCHEFIEISFLLF